jgi:signal transduction histidine kinase
MRRLGNQAIALATAGLLCFSIVGVIRTILVTAHVRDLNARQARGVAGFVAGQVIPKEFPSNRFTSPLYGSAYTVTKSQMNRWVLRDLANRVTIVGANGVIVFSSTRSEVGTKDRSPDVRAALGGTALSPGTGMTPAALFQTQNAVTVYEPLWFKPDPRRSAPDAVAVVDVRVDSETTSAAAALRLVSLGLLAALSALYLLMLKSSWRTMRGLEDRNTNLSWQAELLNERVREEQREVTELRELGRLREDFISMTSHELRTPLTTILGAAKTLQKAEFAEDASIRSELLQATERQADRLSMLVENLLTSARVSGNHPVSVTVFSLGECVRGALESLSVGAERVRVEIPPDLPRLMTDRTALTQVLANLLDNAIKFAPGRPCELGARVPAHGTLQIWVRDEGIGISEDQLTRIFDRFYQVDSSRTRPFGGLGLGLSLVKELVQSLEGTLNVQSHPGDGSTFLITLPFEHSAVVRPMPDLREAG